MSPDPNLGLRRRTLWAAAAAFACALGLSSALLPEPAVPPRGFHLGLDQTFRTIAVPQFPDLVEKSPATTPPDARLSRAARWSTRSLAAASQLAEVPFGREIRRAAERHGLDSLLLAAVVEVESGFHAEAVSPKGALGLMQLMPMHLEGIERPLDPAVNLELGARYLGDLRRRYGGDLVLTLAAYHAGPGAVDRFGGLPPYRETRAYVTRVMEVYQEHQAGVAALLAATGPGSAAHRDGVDS